MIANILTMVILTRNIDLRRWKKLGDWKLVYGRRKTGKTFFVKNFTEWDEYFFVRRDGVVIDEDGKMNSVEASIKSLPLSVLVEIIASLSSTRFLASVFHERIDRTFIWELVE